MTKLPSIYPQVKHILEAFGGLSNTSKPWTNLMDLITIKGLTMAQFEKYQSMRTRLEFLSQVEFESITSSKTLLGG